MAKRVFISSTVYDLLDVRAELRDFLTELGLTPVMSDEATSDFVVLPDANSIETCLVNVDACDYFLCVLSQRYGPRLGEVGFDNISATHLEYRRAREQQKPILIYVRDRLESDYAIWKRNNRNTDTRLSWVRSERDIGLLELLDEHQELRADTDVTNWYSTFRTSSDLKETVQHHLRAPATHATLERAISAGQIPIIDIHAELTREWWGDPWEMTFALRWQNVGGAPAYKVRLCEVIDQGRANVIQEIPVLASGQHMEIYPHLKQPEGQRTGLERQDRFLVESQIPGGVKIHDEFSFYGAAEPDGDRRSVRHQAKHESRRFIIADEHEPLFEIIDASRT